MPVRRPILSRRRAALLLAGPAALLLLVAAARELSPLPTALDAGWQGEKVCERLFEAPWIRLGRCSFAPGIGHERHWHPPHMGYALTPGRMRIDGADGIEVRDIPAGASWLREEIIAHEALNVGETTASYIIAEPERGGLQSVGPDGGGDSAFPDALAAGWQGRPVCELLQEDPDFRMYRCVYPPGVGQDAHTHGHYVGYVTKGGRMRVKSAGGAVEQSFAPREVYASEGVDWHSAVNIGDSEFETVIVEAKE